jgi:hypothetical protein
LSGNLEIVLLNTERSFPNELGGFPAPQFGFSRRPAFPVSTTHRRFVFSVCAIAPPAVAGPDEFLSTSSRRLGLEAVLSGETHNSLNGKRIFAGL